MIIYPEGTATRDPAQWPMVAKTGVARLALATGRPGDPGGQLGQRRTSSPTAANKLHRGAPARSCRCWPGRRWTCPAYAGRAAEPGRPCAPPPTRSWPTSPGCSREIRGEQPPAAPYDPGRCPPRRAAGGPPQAPSRPRQQRRRPAGGPTSDNRGRRRQRESGGHGRGHVGHHVRPGAVRRRELHRALGPARRSWPRRSTTRHENPGYLPGIALTPALRRPPIRPQALDGAGLVVLAVPAQTLRQNLTAWTRAAARRTPPLVSLMKGIELGTCQRMSQVIAEVTGAGAERIAVISGPNLAREIAQRQHAATVVACADDTVAEAAAAGLPHALLPPVHQPRRGRLRTRRRGQERDRARASASRSAWGSATTPGPPDHPGPGRDRPARRGARRRPAHLRRAGGDGRPGRDLQLAAVA